MNTPKHKLTQAMHDSVKASPVGQYLDRLIREDFDRNGGMSLGGGGNVIQQLWAAFMAGRGVEYALPDEQMGEVILGDGVEKLARAQTGIS